MNRTQLTALRTHAREQYLSLGTAAAQAALAPFIEAIAKEFVRTNGAYLDHDYFDSDEATGRVIEHWQHSRASRLATNGLGVHPGELTLARLVDDYLEDNDKDSPEILDEEVFFSTSVANLLRSTAIKVFGHGNLVPVLEDCVIEQVRSLLYDDWKQELRRALSRVYAEFVYVPNWDGANVDDMSYALGLRARSWNNSLYVDEIQPCDALAKFLQWINIGTDDLIAAARAIRPDEADKLADALADFRVERDPTRASLVSPEDAIAIMENAVHGCVPMAHCEINLSALLSLDPDAPMALSTAAGKIHIGLHCPIRGTGYMDTYPGTVTVPADHCGFGWVGRWSYGIDSVYGLVKHVFRVTPEEVRNDECVAA